MRELKDGIRAHVRLDWTGRVHKRFLGSDADKRFENEVKVLKVLEQRGAPNVPRLLEEHPEELYIVTSSCGQPAPNVSSERVKELFAELERKYGVRHLDAERRNVTYDAHAGRFCLIDFELAEILDAPSEPEETSKL